MASLTDLFSPTFLMFLGILVLIVALLVVYFESKMREQNHKMTAMLSLVSSLADELNSVKNGVNHLSMRGGGVSEPFSQSGYLAKMGDGVFENKLINVSDDEESIPNANSILDLGSSVYDEDDDEDDDDDDDDEDDDDENDLNEFDAVSIGDDSTNEEPNAFKKITLTLNNSFNENDIDQSVIENFSDHLSLSSKKSTEELIQSSETFITQQNDAENEEIFENDETVENTNTNTENSNLQMDLKTININLEEQVDSQDYKKLSLNKLKSIVTEKGLIPDASKLKKIELLKMLGVE